MKRVVDVAIIGTGPSAIAAAAALIQAGRFPTFIEAGRLTRGLIINAANRDPGSAVNSVGKDDNSGQKAWFGSYETYSQRFPEKNVFEPHLNARPSNHIGGFSRVWGATFDFWKNDNRWPVAAKISEEDYGAIRNLVPHSKNAISNSTEKDSGLVASLACTAIYRKLSRIAQTHSLELRPSILAIETKGQRGCIACSRCLDGCPQDSIWFAGNQLQSWLDKGSAAIVSGALVETIRSHSDYEEISCLLEGDESITINAAQVFLAAGALGTGMIALQSGVIDTVSVRDTSTIFTAGLTVKKTPTNTSGHSLSQFWIKWRDEFPVTAQAYAPNKSNLARLTSRFKFLRVFASILNELVMRLHPIILYLDSDVSPGLRMNIFNGRVNVQEVDNPEYKRARKTAVKKLREVLSKAGVFVPPVGTDFSPAGTGYHFGASLPLGDLSDDLGRIQGWNNVHIVDSSVLPYLEVGSITPTVMANAHRIARLANVNK